MQHSMQIRRRRPMLRLTSTIPFSTVVALQHDRS